MKTLITVIIAATIVFAFFVCNPLTRKDKAEKKTSSTRCGNFHEGVFVYKEAEFSGGFVIRTETKQTETSGDSLKVESTIIWDSDCSYKLVFIGAYSKFREVEVPQDTVYVTITEVLSDSSYRYKAVVNGSVTEYTMIKL
jgi:hypothetical protein